LSVGRASFYSGTGNRTADPRPINDHAFIERAIETLSRFLIEHGYQDSAVTNTVIRNPSRRDFFAIINFLFKLIDPGFSFSKNDKAHEEEVVAFFKQLKYVSCWYCSMRLRE
jgi:SMC interacting uncharacterized protein involved in chromosome segregation